MLRYITTRFVVWIPSVLLVMLGVYALAYYGAGDPIKLIFLRAPGDVAYNPERTRRFSCRTRSRARRRPYSDR